MVRRAPREVRIYVEGGGEEATGRAKLRIGFQQFLKPLRERDHNVKWQVIPCGGRKSAYDYFCVAEREHPDSLRLLLVDAEGPVRAGHTPWQHLQARKEDRWDPIGDDSRCHLMVTMMEAWIIADRDALASYFGKGFRDGALPAREDVEAIPKEDIVQALARATCDTQKGSYHKLRHGAELLGKIAPDKVRLRAQHCDRLFKTLELLLNTGW